MPFVTRFAPSPTGYLHLGHAYSALAAFDAVTGCGGTFLLRIEDIDHTRCRPEFVASIFDDLAWLGLSWVAPVWFQSRRMDVYRSALARLTDGGLVYPCFCSRTDIRRAATRTGPEGPVYPGTCRDLGEAEITRHLAAGKVPAWRLDMARALRHLGGVVDWPVAGVDGSATTQHWPSAPDDPQAGDDVVLARRDIGTSYHLSVTVDDAAQGVTHVIRGRDLLHATPVHVVLQRLLGLSTPVYRHHMLLTDEDGRKLAKRRGSPSLRAMREDGIDGLALAGDIRSRLRAETN